MEREESAPGASGAGEDGDEKSFNIVAWDYDCVNTQISD
jgi:hypothetical protein